MPRGCLPMLLSISKPAYLAVPHFALPHFCSAPHFLSAHFSPLQVLAADFAGHSPPFAQLEQPQLSLAGPAV